MAWLMRARKAQKAAGSLRGDDLAWDLAGDHVHRGHQGYGAVPDVFELAPLAAAGPGSPGGVLAGPGLDAGLLTDAEQHRAGRRGTVQVADGPGLAEEGRVVFAVEPAADQVRLDVCLGQYPAGLAGGDRDLMLSGQVRGDTGVGPRRPGAGGLAGGGRDDQQPGVDVVDQGPAGAGPVFHRAHALGEVAAAGGPDGVGTAAQ